MLLTGHGGFDCLEYRTDVPVPRPKAGEVLIRVSAAGVNNTDLTTLVRVVLEDHADARQREGGRRPASYDATDASWTGAPLRSLRIQGADCCGHIVAVGQGVARSRVAERVIVAALLRHYRGFRPFEADTLGSAIDGAFAQYIRAPSCEAYRSSAAGAASSLHRSMPCSSSTAENMPHTGLGSERVLVTGASGGVGTAAVQRPSAVGRMWLLRRAHRRRKP